MQNTREVYLVELTAFKNEAKNIKKSNKHIQTYSHTKTLNTLAIQLGFNNYNEYENYLNNRDIIKSKSLFSLTMEELINLRQNIKEAFHEVGFSLEKVYFIEHIYNKKIETMKRYSPYSIGLYLYTLPYILGRPELNCINLSTSQLNEDNAREVFNLAYQKYTDTNNDIFKHFESLKNGQLVNNMFDIYNILVKSNPEYINRVIDSSFINKNFNHPSDISYNYREFYFALDDRNKKYKRKESLIFEWMMKFNNEDDFPNLVQKFKEELEKETLFINQFSFMDKSHLNRELQIPNFHNGEHYQNDFSETVSKIKNNTDFEKPFLLGTTIKKQGLISTILKKEEFIHLNQKQASEHMLITGSAGSGKTSLLYSYAAQSMMNNKGFVFVSFGNPSSILILNKLAEKFNVSDKLIILSINHHEINNIDINELINQNNIVVISASFENDEQLNRANLIKINTFLSKIDTTFKGYYPFSIFFDNITKFDDNSYELFIQNLKKFKKFNCKLFLCINNLNSLYTDKENFLNYFKHILILKLESIDDFQIYKHYVNEHFSIRDLTSQDPMRFYYINLDNPQNNNFIKGFLLLPFALHRDRSFPFSNSNINLSN